MYYSRVIWLDVFVIPCQLVVAVLDWWEVKGGQVGPLPSPRTRLNSKEIHMSNAWFAIRWETIDYFHGIGAILKDIRMPWDPPGLGPEYFAFG